MTRLASDKGIILFNRRFFKLIMTDFTLAFQNFTSFYGKLLQNVTFFSILKDVLGGIRNNTV